MKLIIAFVLCAAVSVFSSCGAPEDANEDVETKTSGLRCVSYTWYGSCAQYAPNIPAGGRDCTGAGVPRDFEIYLYTDPEYSGQCVSLMATYPSYGSVPDTAALGFNNNPFRIRSILGGKCTPGWLWLGAPNWGNYSAQPYIQIVNNPYDFTFIRDMDTTGSIIRSIETNIGYCPNPH